MGKNELRGQPFIAEMVSGVENLCRDCKNCISSVFDEKQVYKDCSNNNAKRRFGFGSDKQLLDVLDGKTVRNYCKYYGTNDKAKNSKYYEIPFHYEKKPRNRCFFDKKIKKKLAVHWRDVCIKLSALYYFQGDMKNGMKYLSMAEKNMDEHILENIIKKIRHNGRIFLNCHSGAKTCGRNLIVEIPRLDPGCKN